MCIKSADPAPRVSLCSFSENNQIHTQETRLSLCVMKKVKYSHLPNSYFHLWKCFVCQQLNSLKDILKCKCGSPNLFWNFNPHLIDLLQLAAQEYFPPVSLPPLVEIQTPPPSNPIPKPSDYTISTALNNNLPPLVEIQGKDSLLLLAKTVSVDEPLEEEKKSKEPVLPPWGPQESIVPRTVKVSSYGWANAWECSKCTTVNRILSDNCETCGEKAPFPELPSKKKLPPKILPKKGKEEAQLVTFYLSNKEEKPKKSTQLNNMKGKSVVISKEPAMCAFCGQVRSDVFRNTCGKCKTRVKRLPQKRLDKRTETQQFWGKPQK